MRVFGSSGSGETLSVGGLFKNRLILKSLVWFLRPVIQATLTSSLQRPHQYAMYAIADIFLPITPMYLLVIHLTHGSFLRVSFRRIVSGMNFSHLPYLPGSGTGRMMLGKNMAYLRSFSIRSTCVMIMRRQQYRLHPSWSIASLVAVRFCSLQGQELQDQLTRL